MSPKPIVISVVMVKYTASKGVVSPAISPGYSLMDR